MHPPAHKRARFLHVLLAGLILGGVLGTTGCSSNRTPRPSPFVPADTLSSTVDRDSVLAVLTSMRRTAFDSSFSALDEYAFTRSVRTEQMTPAGTTTAIRSYVARYRPRAARVPGMLLRRDSVGTVRGGGLFGWAAPNQNPEARPTDLADQILPDQPAFVEARTREAFTYALQPDSLSDGTPTWILDATARTHGTGQEQSVRYARLTIERASKQLIGLLIVRDDDVLLFGEESRTSIRLRRADDPEGPWVPHVVRARSSVDIPFQPARQFRVVSAFYNYRR